jgi:hypothetical protein
MPLAQTALVPPSHLAIIKIGKDINAARTGMEAVHMTIAMMKESSNVRPFPTFQVSYVIRR